MPELPEVQVMVDAINTLRNKRVISVVNYPHNMLKNTTGEILHTHLERGLLCTSVRYGKWLSISFHKNVFYKVFIHNSMHGRIRILTAEDYQPHQHDRLMFSLGDNPHDITHYLVYRDMRCWGQIHFFDDYTQPSFITKLGIDGLGHHGGDVWKDVFKKHGKKSIGDVLLLQECVAGIGNIYRAEICFEANVSPFRFVRDITDEEWEWLANATSFVLTSAHRTGGSSISDFENPYGKPGSAQYLHKVYAKHGTSCVVCGTTIKVEMMTKRKIYFCPQCQK